MYVCYHGLAMFYVSLNVLFRALSFGLVVAPQLSGSLVLIKVVTKVYAQFL